MSRASATAPIMPAAPPASAPIIARVKALRDGATVAQVDEVVAAVSAALALAEAAHARLTKERRAVLLSGDDAAAAEHDTRLAAESRNRDRAAVLLEDIAPKRAAAAAREESARLDALAAEGAALSAEMIGRLDSEYAALAEKLAAFLGEWSAAESKIKRINAELRTAGRLANCPYPESSRTRAARIIPEKVDLVEVWQMPANDKTWTDVPVALLKKDASTGEMAPYMRKLGEDSDRFVSSAPGAQKRTVRRVTPEYEEHPGFLAGLAIAVALPPTRYGEAPFWRGDI